MPQPAEASEPTPLFHYWHDGTPPTDALAVMETWSSDPAFDCRLFDEASAATFIEENLDRETLRAFRSCAVPSMQSDLFRFAALLVHGGVYADVSVRNVGAADLFARCGRGHLFLRGTDEEPEVPGQRPGRVITGVMFIRNPGDPLMEHALRTATANVFARLSNNAWEVTGPGVFIAPYRQGGDEFERLFSGFEIQPVERVRDAVRLTWLPYKSGATDWRQYLDRPDLSVFRDPASDGSEGRGPRRRRRAVSRLVRRLRR